MTEYWMEERPDHLVAFHVRLNLKTPEPIGRFGSLLVADPEFYIDFEFDDPPNGVVLDNAPAGLLEFAAASRRSLEGDDKQKLDESFFTDLVARRQFRLQNGEPGDPRMSLRRGSPASPPAGAGAGAGDGHAAAPVRGRRRRGRRRLWRLDRLAARCAIQAHACDGASICTPFPHDATALWALIGVGFVYGVAHAAGPGHGKAVIASYMMANDAALRRGIVLALLAALLQGAVAVAIVGVAAVVFNATAARMNEIADGLGERELSRRRRHRRVAGVEEGFRAGAGGCAPISPAAPRCRGGVLFAGAPWRPRRRCAGRRLSGGRRAAVDDDCGHAPRARSAHARRGFLLARGAGDGRRGRRAALLGRAADPGVRAGAGAVLRSASRRCRRCRSARRSPPARWPCSPCSPRGWRCASRRGEDSRVALVGARLRIRGRAWRCWRSGWRCFSPPRGGGVMARSCGRRLETAHDLLARHRRLRAEGARSSFWRSRRRRSLIARARRGARRRARRDRDGAARRDLARARDAARRGASCRRRSARRV